MDVPNLSRSISQRQVFFVHVKLSFRNPQAVARCSGDPIQVDGSLDQRPDSIRLERDYVSFARTAKQKRHALHYDMVPW